MCPDAEILPGTKGCRVGLHLIWQTRINIPLKFHIAVPQTLCEIHDTSLTGAKYFHWIDTFTKFINEYWTEVN